MNSNHLFNNLFSNDLKQIPEIQSELSDSSPILPKNFQKNRKPFENIETANFSDKKTENLEKKNRKNIGKNKRLEKENFSEVFKPKNFMKKTLKRPEKPNFFSFKSFEESLNDTFFEKNIENKKKLSQTLKLSPETKPFHEERNRNFMNNQKVSKVTCSVELKTSEKKEEMSKSEKKTSFSIESKRKLSFFNERMKKPSFFTEFRPKVLFNVFDRRHEKPEKPKKPMKRLEIGFFEKQYQFFKQKQLDQNRELELKKAVFKEKELKECTFKPKIQPISYLKKTKYLTFPNKQLLMNCLDLDFEKERENCTFSPKINVSRSISPAFKEAFKEVKNEKKTVERMQKARWEKKLKDQLFQKGFTSNEKLKKGLQKEIVKEERKEFEKIRFRKKSLDKLSEDGVDFSSFLQTKISEKSMTKA